MRKRVSDTTRVIAAFMSKSYDCMTLDELEYLTHMKREKLIRILHELYKEGYIKRHWRHYKRGKERIYCLDKSKIIPEKAKQI